MDGLSIFLERSRDEEINVMPTFTRPNVHFAVDKRTLRTRLRKVLTLIHSAIYLRANLVQRVEAQFREVDLPE